MLELLLILLTVFGGGVLSWIKTVLFFLLTGLLFVVFYSLRYSEANNGNDGNQLTSYLFSFSLCGVFLCMLHYLRRSYEMCSFNNFNMGGQKSREISEFINRLLPKHIQDSINNPGEKMGELYENVTLLFADIAGFTAYSAGKPPKDVVRMLSELFTEFDKECNRLDLYKVYTIGDCYVVMGFLDKNNRKPPEYECQDIVQLSLTMIDIIAKTRKAINFDGLTMRIGVHTGNIIGGVIGTDIIRFDVYGQDVVIANKMESSGAADMINVSRDSKELLEKLPGNPYKFVWHEECEIKALKKKVDTWFLTEDDDDY